MHNRLLAMGQKKYQHDFEEIQFHPEELAKIKKIKKPTMIFVNSMSDLFHEKISFEFISSVMYVFEKYPHHTFQILTKRADRLFGFKIRYHIPDNVWIGVTVENIDNLERIYHLVKIPHSVRFISFEPLLSRIPIAALASHLCGTGFFTDQGYNTHVDWIIVGGETGPNARQMNIEWAKEIRDFCIQTKIPFFFKKQGGTGKDKFNRELDGEIWEQWPEVSKGGRCG